MNMDREHDRQIVLTIITTLTEHWPALTTDDLLALMQGVAAKVNERRPYAA